MEFVESDLHDSLVATYQTLEVARLNEVLKENGVNDTELRRTLCESYFFSSGYFLDSCWFADLGYRVRPKVVFEVFDEAGKSIEKTLLPNPETGTAWHEYAHGAAAWLFDDHAEDASEIVTGDAAV